MSKTNYELWLHGWHFELQHGFETNNDSALCKNMWHVYRQTYMYSICNITSQLWHIFILSDYYHAIHIVYIHAFLLQMYTSSLSLPPQLLLRCNYDAPGPRGHLGKSNWRCISLSSVWTCLNRIKKYEKMWKPSHNQEPFASRMWHRWVDFWFKTVPYIHKFGWNLQLEWFNNPQVPGRLTCTPVKNKVKTTIRLVKSKLHPRVHHALLINLWRTRKPITR